MKTFEPYNLFVSLCAISNLNTYTRTIFFALMGIGLIKRSKCKGQIHQAEL